jgi:hypothetical protein
MTTESIFNQFADEEVASSYVYPSGYKVKGVTAQISHLRELFPGIGYADEQIAGQPLPPNAEGWFAIPRWEKIAPTYGEAVENVLAMIKKTRGGKLYNYCEGQLGAQQLRQHSKTASVFQKLADQQTGYDILVVPAQFGIRHRGRSVRRTREVFLANEFGLGAFAVGIMLLTHPERLVDYENLWIDCAGDDYSPDGDGQFGGAPCFGFGVGRIKFGAGCFDGACDLYGSSSGFVPQ